MHLISKHQQNLHNQPQGGVNFTAAGAELVAAAISSTMPLLGAAGSYCDRSSGRGKMTHCHRRH
jgi:hypothetical protein